MVHALNNCRRAGVSPGTLTFENLVKALLASPAISIYGCYAHAGNAYASTSLDQASSFLSAEVESVNAGAELIMKIASAMGVELDNQSLVLSVGSTPTAHAASAETKAKLSSLLHGPLELHAGKSCSLTDSGEIADVVRFSSRQLSHVGPSARAHKSN